MKKLLLIVLVTAIAGGSYWLWNKHALKTAAAALLNEPKFVTVAKRDLTQLYRVNGTIVPALSTEIRSETTGTIAKLLVAAGDSVQAGQALLELDQSEVQLRINELKLQIEAAQLRADKARLAYERREVLSARNFINAKDLQDAKTDHLLAINALEAERARLKTLENQLVKTSILAPYAGLVLDLQAKPGMVVTGALAGREGSVLMTIADLSRLKVQADVNQVDVAQLTRGMPVKLSFDSAAGATVPAAIEFISPSALTKAEARSSNNANAETVRNFPIEIGFSSPDPRIRPGMTANIEICIATVSQALSVEIGAVFVDDTETCVFVKTGAQLLKRPVKTGINDTKNVQILEGLKAGEEVSLSRPPKKPTADKKPG